jgi:MSHA biogenesis protein MshL
MAQMLNKSLLPSVVKAGVMIAILCAAGCSSSNKKLAAEDALDEVVAQQQQKPAVPPEVAQALLDDTRREQMPAATAKSNERFDVSVRDVSARDFFLGLVNGTGVNVVVHPEVAGVISLNLNKVTIDDVLRVTRDIYGYEYKHDQGIYTIYPNILRTQVFHVNYLDVQRVGVSDTSVMIGRAQASNSGGNQSNNNSGSGANDDTANLLDIGSTESQRTGASLTPGSRVQTLNRTNFWGSLQHTLTAIIGGDGEDRMVMVSPQAGMIVVKALPHELNAVRDFLERSELSVKRQVILEAKIIEVRLNDGFEAGINWGQIGGQLAYSHNIADGFDISSNQGEVSKWRSITENSSYIDADGNRQLLSIPGREATGSTFASLLRVTDVTKLLSLLETQGQVQVLSSPRVSTVNNQKAVIRVGSDEYFVTGISSNTTANVGSVTSTPNIELSPFFSGISLDVTPQISELGEVILHIHPVVSEVSDQLKVFTVGSEDFALPLALRGIRESDSIVKAANGQVIVLGGLMQERSSNQDGKRPLLGDVPLVNTLFRTKQKSRVKTELVILLRPIVVDDQTWNDQLLQSQQHMQNIGDAYRKQ